MFAPLVRSRSPLARLAAALLTTATATIGAVTVSPSVAHGAYEHVQGTFTHVVCANPDTGLGVGVSSVEGLSSPASTSAWSAPVGLSNCGTSSMNAARAITLQASRDGTWAPGTYGALHYGSVQPDVTVLRGSFFRALETGDPDGKYGYMAVNQHGGLDPSDVFALPRNDRDEGDWKTRPWMQRGTSATPFAPENQVSVFAGMQQGQWNVTAACEPQGAAAGCAQTAGQWKYRLFGGRMTLGDDHVPQGATITGALTTAEVITGSEPLARFSATDRGAGLYRVLVEIDDRLVFQDTLGDGNPEERCRDVNPANDNPYEFAYQRPCPLSVRDRQLGWDPRSVPQGSHRVEVRVEDAAGNAAALLNRSVEFDATPDPRLDHPSAGFDATAVPQITGVPQVGHPLTATRGRWRYADESRFRFVWERCTPNTDECGAILGAHELAYTPVAEDAGRQLRLRVVAANAAGEERFAYAFAGEPVARAAGTVAPPVPPVPPAGPAAAGDAPASGGLPSGTPTVGGSAVVRGAKLTFAAGRRTTISSSFRRSTRLSGRLTDPAGQPLAGAAVRLLERRASAGAAARGVAIVVTDAAGRFAYSSRGPSRTVTAVYGDDAWTTRAAVRIAVPAAVTLKVKPARPGRTTWLTGALTHLPRAGVELQVQAKDGKRWRTFDTTTTRRRGQFRFGYRFKPTAAGRTFQLRVLVRSPIYPFARGTSRAARIRVPR